MAARMTETGQKGNSARPAWVRAEMQTDESLRGQISEVCRALELELDEARAPRFFRVSRVRVEGEFCTVKADPDNSESALDDNLEGCKAQWPGGQASILSVVPERDEINLWYLMAETPKEGQQLRITEPEYLKELLDLWRDERWGISALRWLQEALSCSSQQSAAPNPSPFPKLRRRQAEAFNLLGHSLSFLWGPPGTGKTYTLGAMLAQYLATFPGRRVLILSQINSAVDQALLAVDDRVHDLEAQSTKAAELKGRYVRIGNRWIARNYVGREHLLFLPNDKLVRRLAILDADPRQNHPEDNRSYAEWKVERAQLRAEVRKQIAQCLSSAHLAAMTTTYATFALFDETRIAGPLFDLVVVDEGSQVPLAQVIMLAQLGKTVLIAGDPRQLRPIARADDPVAQEWLAKSMFSVMGGQSNSTCFLDEQNRMASPINKVVSRVFYEERLRVDADSLRDHEWQAYRRLAEVHPFGTRAVYCHENCGFARPEHQSWIRRESADLTKQFVKNLTAPPHGIQPSDILVLTPFRAQRRLIRKILVGSGFSAVTVSTVHRAQGSERHTVIFDCVNGDTKFLKEEGQRIVNVALSRAQARLILLISSDDRAYNAVLELVAHFSAPSAEPDLADALHGRAPAAGEPISGTPSQAAKTSGGHEGSHLSFGAAYGRVKSIDLNSKKAVIEITADLSVGKPMYPPCDHSDWPMCINGVHIEFDTLTGKVGPGADAHSATLQPLPQIKGPIPVDMLWDRADWPDCLKGLHISFRSANQTVTGTVKDVNTDNRKIVLLQDDPHVEKKYSVDHLRQMAAAARA